jgi:hypothetical protein
VEQQLAPNKEIVLRGDVGGFGAGSQFSWQAIATYNLPLCEIHGIPVDSYVGFRALSADFSQGSGRSRFEFDKRHIRTGDRRDHEILRSMAGFNMTCLRPAVGALALLVTATAAARAQQGEDLREAAQNPIADLISVPLSEQGEL